MRERPKPPKSERTGGGPGPAGYAALVAVVLALTAVGLLVANSGLATDAPLADGDSSGHYRQPEDLAEKSAAAMRSAIRTVAPGPLTAPVARGTRTDKLPPSDPLTAQEAPASPAVGPLFYTGQGEPGHGCTASVVHSRRGDLLVTAAHCVHVGGFRTDLAFAPGYKDGVAPYGVWVPTAIDVDPAWVLRRDPDHDVAFVRVRPAEKNGGTPIERVTGAQAIAFDPPRGAPTRVLGYPSDSERPLACQNATEAESGTQVRFDCEGLPNGTSGSPFLTDVDPATGLGTVAGVLGGKDEGGDETTSYSTYFGEPVRKLYRRAAG
ncbi:serine protease [Streptomyces cinnamoneus]|uniref:Serine protease n=1 Tax=Streptomyces cinnamoneus TaxID=53446 RepID=A0A2G1XHZ6_STRCJ|nr:trypsin-like peptidase domain-containing protein [Streptomyces cinnamoneus]PHQ50749.1 serine protease [Streptomyces cinnamoneus]PPT13993.1 serine protease [Streptomyces cinnamoneus]